MKELKYVRLQRSARHRERIVELVRIVANDSTRAATWVAYKEFALVTFLVDWWLEPLAHRNGLNLYKNGANLGMANMLFFCLEGFWSRNFRHKLLTLFQRMIRTRNPNFFNQFEQFIRSEKRPRLRGIASRSSDIFGRRSHCSEWSMVRGLPDRVLDVALPGLIFLGHVWRGRENGPWEVVHDQSTNMAKTKMVMGCAYLP